MGRKAAILAFLAASIADAAADPVRLVWSAPQPVRIEGYRGDAMVPFVSRDGAFLFFNTRNDPKIDTDIHYARRKDDLTFVDQGVLKGTQSKRLDGVPTMSRDGRFCFISPRDYRETLNTVFCGRFTGSDVVEVTPQPGLKTARLGRLIFDVEIAADGNQMVFAEGTFSGGEVPDEANLFLAERSAAGFARSRDSARILAKVNTADAQEYAPSLSADGLELYFTRLSGWWLWRQVAIYRATRRTVTEPFGEPVSVPLEGFVEAPTVSNDGRSVYFHKLADDRFGIWRITRQ